LALVNVGRKQLYRLDEHLDHLEAAIERGESELERSVALRVSSDVPGIRPGMAVVAALDAVFAAQAACMSRASAIAPSAEHCNSGASNGETSLVMTLGHDAQATMCESEARALTLRIKQACMNLCLLLLDAHEGRAWVALEYRTWEEYVRAEFALSRSRSYELLDQGRVRRALCIAAETTDIPPVSARAAAALRPLLGDVMATVRQRMEEAGGDARAVVTRILSESRNQAGSARPKPRRDSTSGPVVGVSATGGDPLQSSAPRNELAMLLTAIECIASVSGPDLLATLSPAELRRLARLPVAARTLNTLSALWLERVGRTLNEQSSSHVAQHESPRRTSPNAFGETHVRHAGHGRRMQVPRDRDRERASAALATVR
jgi:hypothetical protein